MHAPPSGPKSGHTNPFTKLSQDLLEGREALTYRPGFSSKTQPWLQTPSPVVQSYTSLCASPSLPLLALLPCPKWTLSIQVRLWSPPYCPDTKSKEMEHRKEPSFSLALQPWEKHSLSLCVCPGQITLGCCMGIQLQRALNPSKN